MRRPQVKMLIQCKKILLLLVISGAFVIFTTLAATGIVVNENSIASALPQGLGQGRKPTQVAEVELITITPYGFEPSEITRPKGRFIIAYNNLSGFSSVSPQLETKSRAKLHQHSMGRSKRSWIGEFDLPPGEYLIKEPSHPDWVCVLTIK